MARRPLWKVMLVAGLVAGTLDIADAVLFYLLRSHVPPVRILQSVASGLLGRSACAGGWPTASLGLVLHFCIAFAWATLFVLQARFIPALRSSAAVSGVLYGVFIYLFMNFVVLPLSRAAPQHRHMDIALLNGICAIVFLVGLPIAWINRRLS